MKNMQKDISSKILEAENDVFADIFNNLLLDEETKIDPKYLSDEPTESFYTDAYGNTRNMYRDVFKKYSSNQQMVLVSLGIENETQIERPMPIRVMGYAYTCYKKQLDEYNNNKKVLLKLRKSASTDEAKKIYDEELEKLGEFTLVPALTLVLCFDDKEWNQPETLRGLTNGNPYAKLMWDYGITVVNIKHLPKEVRNRFSSDFRYIVSMLCENNVLEEDRMKELNHPVEALDMLIAYTGEKRFNDIRKRIIKESMEGVKITMGNFLDELERNKTVEIYKSFKKRGVVDDATLIDCLSENLNITKEEATEIFKKEVCE